MFEPESLKDFVGQDHIKEELDIAMRNSVITREVLGHTVFLGPPGHGKTTLARIAAGTMNYRIMELFGGSFTEEEMDDIIGFVSESEVPAIIFIDEIHAIKPKDSEFLYVPMEEFRMNGVDIPPFSVIGATTEFGKVIKPLRQRFRHQYRLKHYTVDDITKILSNRHCPDEIAKFIAQRSRFTPRDAINRWKDVLMEFNVQSQEKETYLNIELAQRVFNRKEIDDWGLDPIDRSILQLLYNNHSFETASRPIPTGVDAICVSLDLSRADYLGLYEPFLLQMGLIQRRPKGRVATQKAVEKIIKPKKPEHTVREDRPKYSAYFEDLAKKLKEDGKIEN